MSIGCELLSIVGIRPSFCKGKTEEGALTKAVVGGEVDGAVGCWGPIGNYTDKGWHDAAVPKDAVVDTPKDVAVDAPKDTAIDAPKDVAADGPKPDQLKPDLIPQMPLGVGIISPTNGLITNTSIVPMIVKRKSQAQWNGSKKYCPSPMELFVNGTKNGIKICSDNPDINNLLNGNSDTCQVLYAEVPLTVGLNTIMAYIPEEVGGKVYNFKTSIVVTYNPNYSTAKKDLLYVATDACPWNWNDQTALANSSDVAIIDLQSGTAFGKIKATVGKEPPPKNAKSYPPDCYHIDLSMSPDSKTVYFTGRYGIHKIDTGTNKIYDTITFPSGSAIDYSTLHKDSLYITLNPNTLGPGQKDIILLFDLKTNLYQQILKNMSLSGYARIIPHPTLPKVYVSDASPHYPIYETKNFTFTGWLDGDGWNAFSWLGIHPSGKWGIALGSSSGAWYFDFFDATTDQIANPRVYNPTSQNTQEMTFAPKQDVVYLGGYRAYDKKNNKYIWLNNDVGGPLAISPTGNLLYGASNYWTNSSLVEVDAQTGKTVRFLFGDFLAGVTGFCQLINLNRYVAYKPAY